MKGVKLHLGKSNTIILIIALIIAFAILTIFMVKSTRDAINKNNITQILQCVPSSCCHPTSCVEKALAQDCSRIFCTQECALGSLDCGQGSCEAVNGKCEAVLK